MDYVPAHGNTAMLEDREDVSGARVLDGEDQGKQIKQLQLLSLTINILFSRFRTGYGNRYRMQQLQQKDWIDQQIREKQMFKDQAKFTDTVHDE